MEGVTTTLPVQCSAETRKFKIRRRLYHSQSFAECAYTNDDQIMIPTPVPHRLRKDYDYLSILRITEKYKKVFIASYLYYMRKRRIRCLGKIFIFAKSFSYMLACEISASSAYRGSRQQ